MLWMDRSRAYCCLRSPGAFHGCFCASENGEPGSSYFNGSAPAVFGRENRSALSGTCALRKETKNRGICLSQSAGAAFIFYSGHSTIVLLLLKTVCGVDGNRSRSSDAFPVLGSGTILIPWAVFSWIQKDYVAAAVLLTLYVVTMVVREVLEPRLMGKEMGLKPLYVLLSVYVGLKLFGVGGIVLGPIGLTILKTVFEQTSFSHTT